MKWLPLFLLLILTGCVGCEREVFIAPELPEMSADISFYTCRGLPDVCEKGSDLEVPPWDTWIYIEATYTGVDYAYLHAEGPLCLANDACPTASVVAKPGEHVIYIRKATSFTGPTPIKLTATGIKGEYNVKTVIIVSP